MAAGKTWAVLGPVGVRRLLLAGFASEFARSSVDAEHSTRVAVEEKNKHRRRGVAVRLLCEGDGDDLALGSGCVGDGGACDGKLDGRVDAGDGKAAAAA
jgi:hypothetical protein